MKTYKSKDMLGHPDLIEHTEKLGLLLPQPVIENLQTDYLKVIKFCKIYANTIAYCLRENVYEIEENLFEIIKSSKNTFISFFMFEINKATKLNFPP